MTVKLVLEADNIKTIRKAWEDVFESIYEGGIEGEISVINKPKETVKWKLEQQIKTNTKANTNVS